MSTKPFLILYAEDDEEDRFLFLEAVRFVDEDFQIINAENGQEVLRYLSEVEHEEALPLAIISDLQMPLCNGLELLRKIKQDLRWQQIPVILFSTSSSQSDVATAAQLGVEAFFTKPGTYQEFMYTVKQILAVCREKYYSKLTSQP